MPKFEQRFVQSGLFQAEASGGAKTKMLCQFFFISDIFIKLGKCTEEKHHHLGENKLNVFFCFEANVGNNSALQAENENMACHL